MSDVPIDNLSWEEYFDLVSPCTTTSHTSHTQNHAHSSQFRSHIPDEIISSSAIYNDLYSIQNLPNTSNHIPVPQFNSDIDNLSSIRTGVITSLPSRQMRHPRPENIICDSTYRPAVPADQRIILWTTPHSQQAQSTLNAEIPPHLQKKVLSKLLLSIKPDTRTIYGAGLLRFNQFCDHHTIPEGKRMPASYILLSAFIANASGSCSGKTIRNWLNGLRLWHILNNAEWHGRHEWISTLKRTADIEGIIFSRPLRNPITPDHLHALRSKLNLNLPRDAAFWAIAVIAFWGCRRLGELTMKSSRVFNLTQNVSRATSISYSIVNRRRVISFHLPWTKTTGINGGNCIITETGDDLCPIWAFNNHLIINALPNHINPNSIALFAYRLNIDSFHPPVKKISSLLHPPFLLSRDLIKPRVTAIVLEALSSFYLMEFLQRW